MNDADFAQWEKLVHYVIHTHFDWAFKSKSRRYRRQLDYDDLVQEGNLALIDAWERWHDAGGASFKTYAYTAILRKIHRFVDSNLCPVTTKNWQSAARYDDTVRQHLATAVACRLFSETGEHGQQSSFISQIEGDKSVTSPEDILHEDWVEHCMVRLGRALNKREIKILLERAAGRTFAQIGSKRGITRERARKVHSELLVKAAVALLDQEVNLDG